MTHRVGLLCVALVVVHRDSRWGLRKQHAGLGEDPGQGRGTG